jgi:hypothetical protein
VLTTMVGNIRWEHGWYEDGGILHDAPSGISRVTHPFAIARSTCVLLEM